MTTATPGSADLMQWCSGTAKATLGWGPYGAKDETEPCTGKALGFQSEAESCVWLCEVTNACLLALFTMLGMSSIIHAN